MTTEIYFENGGFIVINSEIKRQFYKVFPPTLHVDEDIGVGTYDIMIEYSDTEGTQKQESTTIIATDNCLTPGLQGLPFSGDHDLNYIIESPNEKITFTNISNGECKYSTNVHIDSINSGISLDTLGLTLTETVFEKDPPSYPLETFKVTPSGESYLDLFTDNYSLDSLVKIIHVVITSLGGLEPETL